MRNLTVTELDRKLSTAKPDNDSRNHGYALVDVLDEENFNTEHIPGSINIPGNDMGRFEELFDKNKEIIVYCHSTQCPASEVAALELSSRGFDNVFTFKGGMVEWRENGNPVDSGKGNVREMHIC